MQTATSSKFSVKLETHSHVAHMQTAAKVDAVVAAGHHMLGVRLTEVQTGILHPLGSVGKSLLRAPETMKGKGRGLSTVTGIALESVMQRQGILACYLSCD